MTDVPPSQPPLAGARRLRRPAAVRPGRSATGGPGPGGQPPFGPAPGADPGRGGQGPHYSIGPDGQVRSQPPSPPSSRNRTVIIVTIIVVLLLAGGVIAAILVLTDDDGHGSSPSTTSPSSAPRTSTTSSAPPATSAPATSAPTTSAPTTSAPTTSAPQPPSGDVSNGFLATATAAGNEYFRALAAHDLAGLRRIACPSTTITLAQTTLDRVTGAKPAGPARVSGTTATMNGQITGNDHSTASITAHLAEDSGRWCLAGTQVG